jgi:PAS domain S-box-containing protein
MTAHSETPAVDTALTSDSPELYRQFIASVVDYAIFGLDAKGNVITWNPGAQRIKGYIPEEIIGRHFSAFYPPEDVAAGKPAHELQVAAREGRFEDEGWRVRKDGSRFWASVIITALRDDDGRLLGFSKITRDLTERRLHEEALRQSEQRFRLLVDAVQDYAIFMLDPEGVVASWNSGAARMKGYPREEIVGKHFSRFFTEEDIAAGKPWEELAAARRDGRADIEGWRVKKNGTRFWARAVISAVHDEAGQLRGFAKVTQDLTERRHVQDLEKAAQNVNEFIAMLAHELRNPLAPIKMAVEVMAKAPQDAETCEAMRRTIDRQSAQLARIVDDMIDIARITRGSLVIEHAPVELGDVVRRAVETAAPAVAAARHALEVEVPNEGLVVHGDRDRLTQLVANLLNNAARYTAAGGRIWVRASRQDGHALLSVRDTGRGIEPQIIERIFDMFVQGRSALERVGGGLGIGLALARRIAELHGGTLDAKSEGANRGAEFVLRLPLSQAPAPAEPARAEHKTALPRRILVVDDNIDAATTLDVLLRSLGHETRVAHDGMTALEIAREFRPQVILLDIGMPGLDGYEVARRLRAMNNGQTFRIVAITGWGQDADRKRSKEAGFDLHLVKPVDPNVLVSVLEQRNGATLH